MRDEIGRIVRANAGRDAGEWFFVVGGEDGRLLLADGRRRRIGNEIASRLALLGVPQVVMTAFDPEERELYDKMAKGE